MNCVEVIKALRERPDELSQDAARRLEKALDLAEYIIRRIDDGEPKFAPDALKQFARALRARLTLDE